MQKKADIGQKGTSERKAGKPSNLHDTGTNLQNNQLMELFENELKDIYWAEKALTKAIPKMIKNVTSKDLAAALDNHLNETEEQVSRLEQIFEGLGKKAVSKK